MTNSNMSKIPAPPFTYLSGEKQILDLTDLNALIAKNEAVKQEAYDLSSKIKTALMKHRASIEKNVTSEERAVLRADLDALIQQALQQHQDHHNGNGDRNDNMKNTRLANLSFTFGDFVRQKAYMHFLETGTLLPQSSLDAALSDEEYLSGIISMNHDISRYVIGKGTARDAQSVMLARDLISSVLDHLMKYDFRNGNLRRKYGKYCYLVTCYNPSHWWQNATKMGERNFLHTITALKLISLFKILLGRVYARCCKVRIENLRNCSI